MSISKQKPKTTVTPQPKPAAPKPAAPKPAAPKPVAQQPVTLAQLSKPKNILEAISPVHRTTQSVSGTWGPTSGILGFLNPFSRDYAKTEYLSGGSAPSWANNPLVYKTAGTTQKDYEKTTALNKEYEKYLQGRAFNPYSYSATPSTSPNKDLFPESLNSRDQSLSVSSSGYNVGDSGGGDGGDGGGDNYVLTAEEIARRQLENRVNTINNLLSTIKERSREMIANAGTSRDEVIRFINEKYGGLVNQLSQSKDNALNSLDRANREIATNYARANAEMVRASEGTAGRNAALARALGITGSSGFLRTQQGIGNTLADRVGRLVGEETGKLSDIERDVAGVNTWAEQKKTDIENEKTNLQAKAYDEYQQQIGKIQFNEQVFGIDQAGEAEAALNEYQAKINAIENYMRNKENVQQNIQGQAATTGQGITNWGTQQASKLSDILSKTQGLNLSKLGFTSIDPAQYTPATNVFTQRAMRPVENEEEEVLRKYLYPTVA